MQLRTRSNFGILQARFFIVKLGKLCGLGMVGALSTLMFNGPD